jgi:hypothetical protein
LGFPDVESYQLAREAGAVRDDGPARCPIMEMFEDYRPIYLKVRVGARKSPSA